MFYVDSLTIFYTFLFKLKQFPVKAFLLLATSRDKVRIGYFPKTG